MKIPLTVAMAAALAFTASVSQATTVHSAYTPLGTGSWLVDFTIANDGTPASFAGFTIDFPNASNLSLVASPNTWDSAVFQRDVNLPDDAFLDSFVVNPANAVAVGQSLGGFRVAFTYAAGATPGALPFLINSATFTPLFAGVTTVSVVPEPGAAVLAALGLAVVGLRCVRTKFDNRTATQEVTA